MSISRSRRRTGSPLRHRGRACFSSSLLALIVCTACNGGASPATFDDLPLWNTLSDLRIGSADDPAYAFGSVLALEVGTDGSIYSLHRQETSMRRWTAEGRPAGTIGRSGSGPGEFRTPMALAWSGGELSVLDGQGYRVSYFTPEGVFVRAHSPRVDLGTAPQIEAGAIPARPAGVLADGTLYAATPAFSQAVVEGSLTRIAHLRMDLDGAPLDTLAILPIGTESILGVLREDGSGTFTQQPFGDGVLSTVTNDRTGLLVLERPAADRPGTAEFRLTRIGLRGDTVYSRRYAYEPVAIPAARVDSATRAIAERLHAFVGARTGTSVEQWRGWVRNAAHTPAFYPPVGALVSGRDGSVWLSLEPAGADERTWLVLGPDGGPVARVVLPIGTRVLLPGREHLWAVETDDLDVPYIVRYVLQRGARAE